MITHAIRLGHTGLFEIVKNRGWPTRLRVFAAILIGMDGSNIYKHSLRELAEFVQVNPEAVKRAVKFLKASGIIAKGQGYCQWIVNPDYAMKVSPKHSLFPINTWLEANHQQEK